MAITLRNLVSAPLEVQGLGAGLDEAFSLEPAPPFVIGGFDAESPGSNEVNVVLRFAPVTAGERRGEIVIVSDDPTGPVQTVGVNGTGHAG